MTLPTYAMLISVWLILVQVRDVRRLRGDDANMLAIWRGEEEQTAHDQKRRLDNDESNLYQKDMLSRVQRWVPLF